MTSEDPSDLIVNASDILQRWTNGVLKAGLHRVSVPRQFQIEGTGYMLPDRYSLAFFQRPGEGKSAGPIRDFVTEDRPVCYDEISALEHLERRKRLVYRLVDNTSLGGWCARCDSLGCGGLSARHSFSRPILFRFGI